MSVQRVQVLDTLLALKAIALSEQLTGNQKRVATALIDHFNRKTGQCDPSLDTLAALLGISRRTVIRTMLRLERVGFFRKVRHGGHFHRNQYEPIWSRFRTIEAEWKRRRKEHSARFRSSEVAPLQGHPSHSGDDNDGTQTYPINQTLETSVSAISGDNLAQRNSADEKKRLCKTGIVEPIKSLRQTFHVKQTSSRDAAKDAAERRWCNALSARYDKHPVEHARALEAIDAVLHAAATAAELAKPGTGLFVILARLREDSTKGGQP